MEEFTRWLMVIGPSTKEQNEKALPGLVFVLEGEDIEQVATELADTHVNWNYFLMDVFPAHVD